MDTRETSIPGVHGGVVTNPDGTDIVSSLLSNGIEGSNISVGTTAVEMTFSTATKSISIQADHDNTGKIWVGGSNVSNAGANAFARLAPGQAITVDFDDSSDAIYAVSDTAGQTVYKVALT